MGPKPIQDVAPPVESKVNSTGSSAPKAPIPQAAPAPVSEPASGPEIVSDIPVRAPVGQASDEQKPQPAKNDDSSFFVPAAPLPAAIDKANQKLRPKDSKPKPTLAIVVALLATACLAGGAYLKFFSNR